MTEVSLKELGGTLQRVLPFRGDQAGREQLRHLWVESHDGKVTFSMSNGFTLAQVCRGDLDWPEGTWLLDGVEVRDKLAYCQKEDGAFLEVDALGARIGGIAIPVVDTTWFDYEALVQDVRDKAKASLLTDRKSFNKVLRENKGDIMGVSLAGGLARLYVAVDDKRYHLETIAVQTISCQMVQGQGRAAFGREMLQKLVRAAGDWVSLKIQPEGDTPVAALVEGPDFWAVSMTRRPFPKEALLTQQQRDLLEWVQEMLTSVRKGEVTARVQVGDGQLTVSWEPEPDVTTVELVAQTA